MQNKQNEWLLNKIKELGITDVEYDSLSNIISIKTQYGRVDVDCDQHEPGCWRVRRSDGIYPTNIDNIELMKMLGTIRLEQLKLMEVNRMWIS